MRNGWIIIFLFLMAQSFAQKPFTGKLVYQVEIADTALAKLYPPSQLIIYTNDTIVRIETRTASLGDQVTIKHLALDKSYLLLTTLMGNYAVQIPPRKAEATNSYHIKKKGGKTLVAGLKSKRLLVSNEQIKVPMPFYYYPKMSAKLNPGMEQFPGLLTSYYVATIDGIYRYHLVMVEEFIPNRDLFGVPSDYERISMDDFFKLINIQEGE